MTKRDTSKQATLLAVVVLIALGASVGMILYVMSGDSPSVRPQQNDIADAFGDPEEDRDNEAPPRNDSTHEVTDKTVDVESNTGDADIILHLELPENWQDACSCYVQVLPLSGEPDSGGAGDDRLIEIAPGEELKAPLNIAADSMLHIHGENILNVVAGIRRTDHGEQFEIVDAGRKQSHGAPEVQVKKTVINRGGSLHIEILPLVTVRLEVRDGKGKPFLTDLISWEISWNLKNAHYRTGIHDSLTVTSWQSPYDDSAWAGFRAPAGAALNISTSTRVNGWATNPKKYEGAVSLDQASQTVTFSFKGTVIGRIRVLSPDGEPLSTARVGSGRMPESELRPSLMLSQAPTNRAAGIYAMLLTDTPHKIMVGAPQFLHQLVNSNDVPTDGSALDVTLQYGQPLMVVRVEFDEPSAAKRFAVQLAVKTPTRERNPYLRNPPAKGTEDDPTSWLDAEFIDYWWEGVIDLPPEGEIKLLGQPPGLPRVEPVSDYFEFELIERGFEGGLPLRRFFARPISGLRIELVDSDELKWDRGQPAILLVTRALPGGDKIDGARPAEQPEVPFYGVDASKPFVMRLYPGAWVLRVWQGERVGEAEVTIDAGTRDVKIAPLQKLDRLWIELTINDLTRECNAAGTCFFAGHAPLASMEVAREEAARLARWLAEKFPDSVPEEGHVTRAYAAALAAYRDGKLLAPAWLPRRLLVMPKDKLAVYEGVVDWQSRTVTVRRPTWACSVTFEPRGGDEDAAELDEAGWFVAIREYRDEKDPVTINGGDSKVKVAATDGAASIDSLPPGKYVAYYVRAGQSEVRDAETGMTEIRTNLEWCDAATFELDSGHTSVDLPVTRTR